jgi:hypothetical protein
MKQIQPVQIWTANGTKTAEYFDARIIADDLETSATFYWNLNEVAISTDETGTPTESAGQQLAEGNISMSGEEYQAWDGSNTAAYEFVANAIGVVII